MAGIIVKLYKTMEWEKRGGYLGKQVLTCESECEACRGRMWMYKDV